MRGWSLSQLSTDEVGSTLDRFTVLDRGSCYSQRKQKLIRKKLTLIKQVSSVFTKRFCANSNSFSTFPSSPIWTMSPLCLLQGKKKGELRALIQTAKKGNEKIDIPCWCPPLKVITETDSQRLLKILLVGLNMHPHFSQIMEDCILGNDTVWISNEYTWTLTLQPSPWDDETVALYQMDVNVTIMLISKHVDVVLASKDTWLHVLMSVQEEQSHTWTIFGMMEIGDLNFVIWSL